MLSWIVLLVVLAVFVVVGTWLWGKFFGRGEILQPMDDSPAVQERNAELVAAGATDDVRFEVVTRGYRMEQVDAVIEQLVGQLAEAKVAEAAESAKAPRAHTDPDQ